MNRRGKWGISIGGTIKKTDKGRVDERQKRGGGLSRSAQRAGGD